MKEKSAWAGIVCLSHNISFIYIKMEKRMGLNVGGTPGGLHMIHGHLLKVSHVLFGHQIQLKNY